MTATQHPRAVRLEDLHPLRTRRPAADRGVALERDTVQSHITARYLDPNGYYRWSPAGCSLHTQPLMIAAIRTMQLLGGP